MNRSFLHLTRMLAAVTVVASAGTAGAREIAYRAPSECPTSADVTAKIDARAPKGRAASIDIAKTTSGFHGDVVVGAGATKLSRSIDARTCAAVVEAITLVVTLDHEEEDPSPGDDSAAVSKADTPETGAAPTSSPATDAAADKSEYAASAVPHRERSTVRTLVGQQTTLSGVVAGSPTVDFSWVVDVASTKRIGGVALLQPSFRVGLGFSVPSSAGVRATDARLSCAGCNPEIFLFRHAVELCPIGAGQHSNVTFTVCNRTEIGSLTVDVSGAAIDAHSRLWAATGPMAHFRWVAFENAFASAFFEINLGAMGALRRDRFHFDGFETLTASPWAWTFGFVSGLVL